MTQAQPLGARDHPDLQYNEALAAKRMKGMGYLGRSQSLTGPKCSSKQPCRRLLTASLRRSPDATWSPFWSRYSMPTLTATGPANRRSTPCIKLVSAAGATTGYSISTSKASWMLRHTTPSVFLERVEEVRSSCRYLNSYAFCPSAIDVNGLKLAALYTLQDGLP